MKTDALGCRYPSHRQSFLWVALAGKANAVGLSGHDFSQSLMESNKSLLVEGIVNVLSLAPVIDDPSLDQHLHIVGEGWLGDLKRLQNLAPAQLPTGEHIHDPQTLWVGDGL